MTTQLLNNRYQVIRTLGAGGFGETFLAEDTHMPSKRRCVIKLLKPIHNNPQVYQLVQQRFEREAAILEELGGATDQIPSLYAYFESEGQFYLVQEWIEGDTLSAKVQKQGVFNENSVQELLANLLPVLEYVHGKYIVHRDIKPDNIILRYRDGKPVLIDFGAVRESMGTAINSQGNPTSSIVIGTPGYMPSEQAMGRPVYASDLYSLGMTAIYLLTGKYPQQLETDPQTGEILWRQYANNLNPILAGVIDKALAYHPRDRYPTARAMLDALQSVTNSIPPTQAPSFQKPAVYVSLPETVNVAPKPNTQDHSQKGILLGSAIAGGLIGVSVIVGLLLTRNSSPVANQTDSLPTTKPTATPQFIETPKLTPANQSIPTPITPDLTKPSLPDITTTANDYSWLSQRQVTDADLNGKNGFDLDIMRNSIYARFGRRFDTPGLQQYFNKQPWYRPIYSPQEFDKLKLLSSLEMKNVLYIDAYQNRYNLRYFKK
jgi:serine/threonine protein kinase, bacterial